MRGLRYEDAARDQATRFRMIVDEINDHNLPDRLKLRNGGGHQYQRRHLQLITYQTHMAKEFVPAWRAPHWERPYATDASTYYTDREKIKRDIHSLDYLKTINLLGGDYVDGSTYKIVDPFPGEWPGPISDIHLGQEQAASTLMEALGHYRPAVYPQLTIADLAAGVETKLIEFSDEIMRRTSLRARSSGKSMSISRTFMAAYATRRWFEENMRFKLKPYQQSALIDYLNKPAARPVVPLV
ncbi:hypothetical protein [Burkholderia phage FLC9]|nr:hypothetical protein [Burkholderia phage FLC9]